MAASDPAIRQTSFPRLDTLTADSGNDENAAREYHQRAFTYMGKVRSHPRGKKHLLQGYSRFIAAFTGESEVAFQFALRSAFHKSPRRELVRASVPVEKTNRAGQNIEDCAIEMIDQSDSEGLIDFGLELLADPEDFDSTNAPVFLECPFVVQYHAMEMTMVMRYDTLLMDETFADVIFQVLTDELSRTPVQQKTEIRHSVLNHPPLQRPPPLVHVPEDEAPAGLLHSGFQRIVAQYPARQALDFLFDWGNFTINYSQLDGLTTALAVRLRECIHGISPKQTVVPAYMATSPALYISWLAVLKAGFAFCPLPMNAPHEQLQEIVEEVCASLVLTNGPMIGGCPWDAWYYDDDELSVTLDVENFVTTWMKDPILPEQPLPSVSETALANVIYTNGSGGKSNGVKITHLAAACSIASQSKFIPPYMSKRGFRLFQSVAPWFGPSIMEIFTTWWTGGTLCSAPSVRLLTDPEGAINNLKPTIMMATPTMASALRPERIPTLRHLWTMGEELTPKVIRNFSSDSPTRSHPPSPTSRPEKLYNLLNAYGVPEGSMSCTVANDFSIDYRGSIIGQPVDTCSILIIDANNRYPVPVPLGFPGELAIGGPQVSPGYVNRPDQTAAAFVSSPEYGRLYRTGDRGRIVKTQQGELTVEFLGKLTSDRISLRGRKAELADAPDQGSLDPYPTDNLVDSIIEKRTLAVIEETLAEVCNIKIANVSADTDLLSLGLDSVLAIRFLQQLKEKGISNLTLANVLSNRTPQTLASCCDSITEPKSRSQSTEWDARFSDFTPHHVIC